MLLYRGTKAYNLSLSLDGSDFVEVLSGELSDPRSVPCSQRMDVERVSFDGHLAKYAKLEVTSWHGDGPALQYLGLVGSGDSCLEFNTDYYLGDLPGELQSEGSKSLDECKELCRKEPLCYRYTRTSEAKGLRYEQKSVKIIKLFYVLQNTRCWLKGSTAPYPPSYNTGAISGLKNCSKKYKYQRNKR